MFWKSSKQSFTDRQNPVSFLCRIPDIDGEVGNATQQRYGWNKVICMPRTLYLFCEDRTQMPERVEQYRFYADKCLELGESFKSPDAKRTLFAMAAAWLTLAAQRVKNIEMADTSSTVDQDLTPPYDPD